MALLSKAKTKKGNSMDQEKPKELSEQIARIERLSSDLRLSLMSIKSPHTAYAVLLVELDWLAIKLTEIKKRLK